MTIVPRGNLAEVRILQNGIVVTRLILSQKALTMLVLEGREVINTLRENECLV